MEVNDTLINNLANLARLNFDESEKKLIQKELQQMIEFIGQLRELDVEGVEPLMHMTDTLNRLRPDTVDGSVSREDALKNAPETDGTFFRVPKVIRK